MRAWRWLPAACVLALAACAAPPRVVTPQEAALPHWSGRLALRAQTNPPQAVNASFDLLGTPERGELSLFTPLGTTAAELRWAPRLAVLRRAGQAPQYFESLDALMRSALGADVPAQALFDWLRGIPTTVAGWQADLSALAQGRLHAHRQQPAPEADLRLVLNEP